MNEQPVYDVVIAGAGPAGATAAYFLAKGGKRVFIADVSFWRKNPGLIAYDVELGKARRALRRRHRWHPRPVETRALRSGDVRRPSFVY